MARRTDDGRAAGQMNVNVNALASVPLTTSFSAWHAGNRLAMLPFFPRPGPGSR